AGAGNVFLARPGDAERQVRRGLIALRMGLLESERDVRGIDPRQLLAVLDLVPFLQPERLQPAGDLGGNAHVGRLHMPRRDEERRVLRLAMTGTERQEEDSKKGGTGHDLLSP